MKSVHGAVIALALAAALPAAGQSLGEAARRATETRKAGGSRALVFDERDLDPALARQDLLAYQLDEATWRKFVAADGFIADALQKDPRILDRLHALQASSIRGLERFLQREPAMADALQAAGLPPHEYAYTEQAIALVLSLEESQRRPERLAELPPPVRANVAFLTARERELERILPRITQLELHIAPPPSAAVTTTIASATPPAETAGAPGGGMKGGGPEVPDFSFTDFNGGTHTLSEFRGRYVLLDFWGSWCGPCRAEVPFLKEAYAQFQPRRLEVIGLDYEQGASLDQVRAYLGAEGISWTVATPESVKDVIVNRFRVSSFPTLMLIDPDGRVLETDSHVLRGQQLAKTLDMVLPKGQ